MRILDLVLNQPVTTTRPSQDEIRDLSPYIKKVEEHCIGSGRFGDVYQGARLDLPSSASETEKMVAIKIIRPMMANKDSLQKVIKQLTREMTVWQGLCHDNILPFLGVSYSFGRMPALISPWMENGQLNEYLASHPEVDREKIADGVAKGLHYLHTRAMQITHGDIKAANTLVDRDGNPRLTDFGVSRMLSDDSLWMTTTVNARGSIRWMAPELLEGTEILPTPETDVYAFAMTVLEIFTGNIPYPYYRMDGAVIMAVTARKEQPVQPMELTGSQSRRVNLDDLWACLLRCWDYNPKRRPSMLIVEELFRLGKDTRPPAPKHSPVRAASDSARSLPTSSPGDRSQTSQRYQRARSVSLESYMLKLPDTGPQQTVAVTGKPVPEMTSSLSILPPPTGPPALPDNENTRSGMIPSYSISPSRHLPMDPPIVSYVPPSPAVSSKPRRRKRERSRSPSPQSKRTRTDPSPSPAHRYGTVGGGHPPR